MKCKALLAIAVLGSAFSLAQQKSPRQVREIDRDYNRKWLTDVSYVISDEERAVFENLTTPEEVEAFIDQFWRRRDSDPASGGMKVREEHYRRIAYANEHFHSGVQGWKTDRGRVYIINGQPDSIEEHGQGETYYRPGREGGGNTATYAWQLWYYRNIPGIGDVEMEFVDRRMDGNFTMARDEHDKDALLFVPGLGLTESDRFAGEWSKAERIGSRTLANENSRRAGNPLKMWTRKDNLFDRMERIEKLMSPQPVKFKDLEAVVSTNISYTELPFKLRSDLIRITARDYMVPVTFFFDTEALTFKAIGPVRQAEINVYGHIENMTRQRVWSFDDTVKLHEGDYVGPAKRAVYQRNVPMKPGRYKLVAVIKDMASRKLGTTERLIVVPSPKEEIQLEVSPLILADLVQPAKTGEFINDAFILGAVKVYPNPNNTFVRGLPLGFYFEIYNLTADARSLDPSLGFELELRKDGQLLQLPFSDLERLLHSFGDRYYVGSMLSTAPLSPGKYTLTVRITDKIAQKAAETTASFAIVEEKPVQ